MNRSVLLHETPDLRVSRVDHPPGERHVDPARELARGWHINFVQAGSFDVIVAGERKRLRRGSVFITMPGLEFRCAHGDDCPNDVCLSIAFDPDAIAGHEDAWTRARWVAREATTPRLALAQARLAAAATSGDRFSVERWASAALAALGADAMATARGRYAANPSDVAAVVATCEAIERDPAARRSIASRAKDVQRTGVQLTHAFRRYLGVSPHRFVIRHRLVLAAERLAAGSTVSDACYASGFENLSHFCRTFRRAFGVHASQWGALAPREMRRKVQDLAARPV